MDDIHHDDDEALLVLLFFRAARLRLAEYPALLIIAAARQRLKGTAGHGCSPRQENPRAERAPSRLRPIVARQGDDPHYQRHCGPARQTFQAVCANDD